VESKKGRRKPAPLKKIAGGKNHTKQIKEHQLSRRGKSRGHRGGRVGGNNNLGG